MKYHKENENVHPMSTSQCYKKKCINENVYMLKTNKYTIKDVIGKL